LCYERMQGMRTRIVLWMIGLIGSVGMLPAAAQDEQLSQWASWATATSEYSTSDYSAMQATGAPDTDECGDIATAWASARPNTVDALTVGFDEAVWPTEIHIYQTYNPGSIVGVEMLLEGGDSMMIEDSADPGTDCPGVFSIRINQEVPLPVNGVVIHLNQRGLGWNEIDAVELVGQPFYGVEGEGNASANEEPAAYDGPMGMSVTCENGAAFDNGIEVRVIQMRAGFTYTATAIGINGFDPVLAVLDSSGRGLCTDDDSIAAGYSVDLPTTGFVPESGTSSQVFFANNSNNAFENISLVVGGFGNSTGEFVLLLEGMAVTDADGAGDPFSMQVTPGMMASSVVPTVYMIANTSAMDPLIALIDENYDFVQIESTGEYVACDNAGYQGCWGESVDLSNYYVSRSGGGGLSGGSYDAMLRLPLTNVPEPWGFFTFLMRTSEMQTYGDYVLAFHMGIG
jgi:hypothetical protein